jgi:DNA primase
VESRIPEEIVEEVRFRADMVEIVSGYVNLQRKGKNYLGLCPFHTEKTASFTVNQEKQMFHCFGCHVGGNVISFLMRKENWTFPETVRYLADRYGVLLPQEELSRSQQQEQKSRKRWTQILDWAAMFFSENLLSHPEGAAARAYLEGRGVSEKMIHDFRLGYAPNRWDTLLEALRERGVEPEELAEAGLVIEHSPKKYYDRFRHRVIFSILDSRKQPVAFGGRVLDDSTPKYLNSPEGKFFSKGRHLYGMNQAHQGIREKGFALLVEGYLDVIALQQAGWINAVASLGTALTKEQAKLINKYTQRVALCYDSDAAGIQAALRAGEILYQTGLRVDVVSLRDAKDPDEIIRAQGEKAFQEALDQAKTYVEFKFHTMMAERPPQTIPEKAVLVTRLAPDILAVKSPVEREGYERFLSFELGLTLEAVQREILSQTREASKLSRKREYSNKTKDISVNNRDTINKQEDQALAPVTVTVPQGVYGAEWILLRLLEEDLSRLPRLEAELGSGFWRVPIHEKIFLALRNAGSRDFLSYDDEEMLNVWSHILTREIDITQADKIFMDCVRTIHAADREDRVEDLQVEMAQREKSGDFAGAVALLKEIGERLKRDEK